jgi:hypothetical protein
MISDEQDIEIPLFRQVDDVFESVRSITEISAEVDEPEGLKVSIRLSRADHGECEHSDEQEQARDLVSFHCLRGHYANFKRRNRP